MEVKNGAGEKQPKELHQTPAPKDGISSASQEIVCIIWKPRRSLPCSQQ